MMADDDGGGGGELLITPMLELREPEQLVANICNIVATCSIGVEIDLSTFVRRMHFIGAKLNENCFVATSVKFTDLSLPPELVPEITALQFGSGYVVCTGGKSIEQVRQVLDEYARLMREQGGYEGACVVDFSVENIVAKCDYPFAINLRSMTNESPGRTSYDESFPGARIRVQYDDDDNNNNNNTPEPPRRTVHFSAAAGKEEEEEEEEKKKKRLGGDNRVTLVFSTGRLVVPGTSSVERVMRRIEKVALILRRHAVYEIDGRMQQGVWHAQPPVVTTARNQQQHTSGQAMLYRQRNEARRVTGLATLTLPDGARMNSLMRRRRRRRRRAAPPNKKTAAKRKTTSANNVCGGV